MRQETRSLGILVQRARLCTKQEVMGMPKMETPRSEQIWHELALARPFLGRVWSQLLDGFSDHELFARYLGTLYTIVCASVPLMEEASRVCREHPEFGFDGALADYFAEHIIEERDHDRWLMEDLRSIGASSNPDIYWSGYVARLVGSQYYWVHHVHPVLLLGYILVLEGHPPTSEDCTKLHEIKGIPSIGLRTLQHHAVVDTDEHILNLRALLDELPLTREQNRRLRENALHTLFGLVHVLHSLVLL